MPLLHWPSWSKDELIYGWYIAPVTSFAVGNRIELSAWCYNRRKERLNQSTTASNEPRRVPIPELLK